jgi:hypothetical protein
MRYWWRRRESNLSSPFRFCNLLIRQREESAKRPTQACPSYNYRTNFLLKSRQLGMAKNGSPDFVRSRKYHSALFSLSTRIENSRVGHFLPTERLPIHLSWGRASERRTVPTYFSSTPISGQVPMGDKPRAKERDSPFIDLLGFAHVRSKPSDGPDHLALSHHRANRQRRYGRGL